MIAKLIKGKGFRGALEYDLNKKNALLLETNMAGNNPRTLAKELGVIRSLRPNLTKAVLHVSISIHPEEKLTEDQWKEVAQKYLQHMGFENSQYVVTQHNDTEHPHIHIIANRVTFEGNVVSDSHDYKKQESLMRLLEQEYNLQPVISSEESPRKALSKNEVEQALRTGESSERLHLQELIDKILTDKPNLPEFIHILNTNNIDVKLNQASTGRICGISFSCNDIAFKGSDLGKGYTWNNLQQRGLQHENGRLERNDLQQESTRSRPCEHEIGTYGQARNGESEEHRRTLTSLERLEIHHRNSLSRSEESLKRRAGLSR